MVVANDGERVIHQCHKDLTYPWERYEVLKTVGTSTRKRMVTMTYTANITREGRTG
ncbi:hypothetical protein HMPREF1861_02042 [Corynebacterium kroppenstedtii]|nr:hypothetical protein HMPREF1861_02042 [Corynebacterium kroppenstedtii]